ncbi:AI-2E family transporter [soil metagenome]
MDQLLVPGTSDIAAEAAHEQPQSKVLLHMPVDVRSASLATLAVIASLFALRAASEVFIPLMLGVLGSYALAPIVDRIARLHVPRALAAALVLICIVGGIGTTIYNLSDDATTLVESLPSTAAKLREALRTRGKSAGSIDKVQRAASQLEQAAEESTVTRPATTRGVMRVTVEKPRFNVHDYLWSGTVGLAALAGQAAIVCFITYFLLAAGDTFRRKIVRVVGPTFSKRKITVQALDEIAEQIERYLLMQLLTSALVGVATGIAFAMIGLDHAAVWGVVAAVLNLIPYLGSVVLTGGSAMVALVQFGTLEAAMAIAAVSMVIHVITGYILTPWLTSATSRLSAIVVFVGVLAWGWLWGIWGLLLGVPILMVIKAVCDRVDDLKSIGEMLGREPSKRPRELA